VCCFCCPVNESNSVLFFILQPLSAKSKEYILKLDIESDARLLRERLNICEDALDYFRASSSVLKAGVKAGLSLYDIACMCCRNDNQGEIPSKLEVLFSMASDLSYSAVENGRWNHEAASRALADQLTPKGGSLISLNKNKIHKSVSAHQFSDISDEFEPPKRDPLPGMIQSSASDSSSDAGEVEREECDEWAAALIADVSLDKSISLLNTKSRRSPSIESESSSESGLSSSPHGFWHIRPGSADYFDDDDFDDDDDGSVNWSPSTSPENIINLSASTFANEKRDSWTNDASDRRVSIAMNVLEPPLKLDGCRSNTPVKVSWGADALLIPPQSSHAGFKQEPSASFKRLDSGGMTRSKSFSALTDSSAKDKQPWSRQLSFIQDPEQYRDYFLKFVDLVIVREIASSVARQVAVIS
jgi:hypothetical protein